MKKLISKIKEFIASIKSNYSKIMNKSKVKYDVSNMNAFEQFSNRALSRIRVLSKQESNRQLALFQIHPEARNLLPQKKS